MKIIVVIIFAVLGFFVFGPIGSIVGAIVGLAAVLPRPATVRPSKPKKHRLDGVGQSFNAVLARALKLSGDQS